MIPSVNKDRAALLYLLVNSVLLLSFLLFVPYKVCGIEFEGMIFPGYAFGFIAAGFGMVYTLYHRNLRLLALPLFLLLLFAYDSAAPEAWIDARGDWETSRRFVPESFTQSMNNYSASSAAMILEDSDAMKRIEAYARLVPFYPVQERMQQVGKGAQVFQNDRTAHHPPLFFALTGLWLSFGDSLWGMKIYAKAMLLIYLFLIYKLVRMVLKNSPESLWISLAVVLSPALIYATQAPKNDILLGIFSSMLMLILMKRGGRRDVLTHMGVGLAAALCVFTKFTALLIMLPLIALYIYWYRWKALPYLLLAALPALALAGSMYLMFEYDIILNIIIGRVVQDQWITANTGAMDFLFKRVLFGQFRVGLPLVSMLPFGFYFLYRFSQSGSEEQRSLKATALAKSYGTKLSAEKKAQWAKRGISGGFLMISMLFYMAVFLLLWGSSVDRHQIGFLPFALPMLALGLYRLKNLKGFVLSLLLCYNLLFIVYSIFENYIEIQYLM
jgi:hypothetical protein